jgi:hypothetical protein
LMADFFWFLFCIAVITYLLAPFPNIFCSNCGRGYEESQQKYVVFSWFLFAMMLANPDCAEPS